MVVDIFDCKMSKSNVTHGRLLQLSSRSSASQINWWSNSSLSNKNVQKQLSILKTKLWKSCLGLVFIKKKGIKVSCEIPIFKGYTLKCRNSILTPIWCKFSRHFGRTSVACFWLEKFAYFCLPCNIATSSAFFFILKLSSFSRTSLILWNSQFQRRRKMSAPQGILTTAASKKDGRVTFDAGTAENKRATTAPSTPPPPPEKVTAPVVEFAIKDEVELLRAGKIFLYFSLCFGVFC